MNVALVHDWLNTKQGGGEKVLLELAAMYPDAPICIDSAPGTYC